MGRGLRSPTCVSWGRLREAAKDKDCTCFSRSRSEKVSELRETEPWGWEGNDQRRAASWGERWRDLGCRMQDAGARTALFPWHTKGLVRNRRVVCTWTTLASWAPTSYSFCTCWSVDPGHTKGLVRNGRAVCTWTNLASWAPTSCSFCTCWPVDPGAAGIPDGWGGMPLP